MDGKHGLHEGNRMDSMKEIRILIQMGGKFMDQMKENGRIGMKNWMKEDNCDIAMGIGEGRKL